GWRAAGSTGVYNRRSPTILPRLIGCHTRRTMRPAASIGSRRFALDDRCRAVGDDFAHRLADFCGIEPHHQHCIGAHRTRVLDETVDCMTPRLLEQLSVLVDFAADDRAQPRHDVAAQATATDHDPKALTFDVGDPVTGD